MPTDRSGIFKSNEGYLINKDISALEAYKKKKEKAREIQMLKEDVYELKSDMEEIKQLLRQIVKGSD